MPGITLPNFVQTTTRQHFFPNLVDNMFTGNALWQRLRKNARPWPGGRQGVITTVVSDRGTATSFSRFDTLSTAQSDDRVQMTFNPSEYANHITLSGIDLSVNKGQEAFLDVVAAEFQTVRTDMEEKLGTDLYTDGTGNNNKELAGLVYHVDDATNVVTYQGLSRNTYTNLRATLTAQSGALTFTNLATDFDAAQRGTDAPDLIVTTPAVFSIIERLATVSININYNEVRPTPAPAGGNEGVSLAYGANRIAYRGAPIISDEMCTSGNIFTLNTKHLFLYELDYADQVVEATKEGFAWTGWLPSQNQIAVVGRILWAGQMVGDSPRLQARRTGVTS